MNIYSMINMKLAKREQQYIIIAVILLAFLLIMKLFIFPFMDNRTRLSRGVSAKEAALKKIVLMSEEYKGLKIASKSVQSSMERRKKNFTLFSYLEQAASDIQIKEHIKYMKPSIAQDIGPYKESMVEMKLGTISLRQLVKYLYQIDSRASSIQVKRLSILHNKKDSGLLDAVMTISILHKA